MGVLQDTLVPGPIDPTTGLPVPVSVPVAPAMSADGAQASTTFFSRFNVGASHEGRLDPGELKLVAECSISGLSTTTIPLTCLNPDTKGRKFCMSIY